VNGHSRDGENVSKVPCQDSAKQQEALAAGDTAQSLASVERVQSEFQRIIRLSLEHVRSDAGEVRRLAILVLAFGTPIRRAIDDLVIAPGVDHFKFVVRYAAGV
jgi:hypothetical protein